MRTLNRLITTFDEVPPRLRQRLLAETTKSVDLKRVPPKSRPTASPCEDAARKDSAVHVSLSSDLLVKQPGTSQEIPPSSRAEEPSKPAPRLWSEAYSPSISEELLRRAIAPRRRRAVEGVICLRNRKCQHLLEHLSIFSAPNTAQRQEIIMR